MGDDQLSADVRKEVADALFDPANANQALQAEESSPLFELEPNQLGLADDVIIEENSGTAQFESANVQQGLIGVETDGAQANSRAAVETAQFLDYVSGLKAEGGIRYRAVTPGSAVHRWGLGADGRDDALLWEFDAAADEHRAVIESPVGRTVIPESEWDTKEWRPASELPTANATGFWYGFGAYDGRFQQLGTTPDATVATIDKIRYLWYGNGIIVWMKDAVDDSGRQLPRPVVAFVPTEEPAIRHPNLPVVAEVDNNGTAAQAVGAVAGRQAMRAGDESPQLRPTGHLVSSPPTAPQFGSGFANVALIRRNTPFAEGAPVVVTSVRVIGNDQPLDLEVRGRATPSATPDYTDGPSRDRPAGETAVVGVEETDVGTSAPGFLSGEGQIPVTGQGNNVVRIGDIDTPGTEFVRGEPALIRYRSLNANNTTTPTAVAIEIATTA